MEIQIFHTSSVTLASCTTLSGLLLSTNYRLVTNTTYPSVSTSSIPGRHSLAHPTPILIWSGQVAGDIQTRLNWYRAEDIGGIG